MTTFGVHSEVGRLHKVMMHRPELSLKRLTPSNREDLLFDDVLWVEQAQREHDEFAKAFRDRGVEVLYVQTLLEEALRTPGAVESETSPHIAPKISVKTACSRTT